VAVLDVVGFPGGSVTGEGNWNGGEGNAFAVADGDASMGGADVMGAQQRNATAFGLTQQLRRRGQTLGDDEAADLQGTEFADILPGAAGI
jgi:hypothetical protein